METREDRRWLWCGGALGRIGMVLCATGVTAGAGAGAGAGVGAGEVVFVDRNVGGGLGDGSSWADAFVGLQDALASARAEPGRFEAIWIAGGVYTPAPAGGDRLTPFEMVEGVALLGGFEGDEADPSQRPSIGSPGAPVTVLSGDLNGDDNGKFNLTDNSVEIVVAPTGLTSLELDRLTISNGYRDQPGSFSFTAGTALVSSARTNVITDCVFVDNTSVHGIGGNIIIGGDAVSARFERCGFIQNAAHGESSFGGAVYIAPVDSTAEFIDCAFHDNAAHSTVLDAQGGAVYSKARTTTFDGCEFSGNSATVEGDANSLSQAFGGAVAVTRTGSSADPLSLLVTGCMFEQNTASATSTDGFGGRYAIGGALSSDIATTIEGCEFMDNSVEARTDTGADTHTSGAAVSIASSPTTSTIRDSRFIRNSTETNGGMFGGALHLDVSQIAVVEDCVFLNNSAAVGFNGQPARGVAAEVLAFAGSVRVERSVFDGNSIVTDPPGVSIVDTLSGGTLYAKAAESLELRGSTFTGNSVDLTFAPGGDLFTGGPIPSAAGLIADDAEVDLCDFRHNRLTGTGEYIQYADLSAALVVSAANATLTGSLIADNAAPGTAGVRLINYEGASAATVINSTIAGNTSERDVAAGLSSEGPAAITNSIIWGNTSAAAGPMAQQLDLPPASTADSNIIGGWDGSIPGSHNLDADPLFVSPASGDYRLSPTSTAIDSGDNTALPPGFIADLDGNPRRIDDPATPDTGIGDAPIVDRGAFEFISFCPADLASPLGLLDLADIVAFIVAFDDQDPAADLAEPFGTWDGSDITSFIDLFESGCGI